ncbi:hypothetical protein JRQ81_006552, partial [Phrynocephalus forsythii]
RAFTLARLNALPSKTLEGRYQGLPLLDHNCPCTNNQLETVEHVLLICNYYQDL